jgi:hypothetical protein
LLGVHFAGGGHLSFPGHHAAQCPARATSEAGGTHRRGTYNLGLITQLLVGAGTPRELLAGTAVHLRIAVPSADAVTVIMLVVTSTEAAMIVITCAPEPTD